MSRVFDASQVGINETTLQTPSSAVYNNLPKISFSLWVYITAYPAPTEYSVIFVKDPAGPVGYNHFVELDPGGNIDLGGRFDTVFGSFVSTATFTSLLPLNTWHNLIYTFDSTLSSNRALLYLDGSLVAGTNFDTTASFSGDDSGDGWLIGNDSFDEGFTGRAAEAAIWNIALSPSQVAAVFSNGAGGVASANRVGYWHLCGTASPEPDSSGNGNDAVLSSNPPTQGPDSPAYNCSSPATPASGHLGLNAELKISK
jgi:hypothetical protein